MRIEITEHITALESSQDRFFILSSHWKTEEHLEVVADTNGGITVEECRKIAKSILQTAEENEWDIQLDVLSPGAFSPLQDIRQLERNTGRTLDVTWKDASQPPLSAELISVEDTTLTFRWSERRPKTIGKGKETVVHELTADFETIDTINVKLPF